MNVLTTLMYINECIYRICLLDSECSKITLYLPFFLQIYV